MKKILCTIIALSFLTTISFAQNTQTPPAPQTPPTPLKKDTAWKKGGFFSVNFNQVSLSNWAAGGENSLSLAAMTSGFANYKKDKISWDNSMFLAYGIIQSNGNPSKKNQDKIELNSKIGYKATDKLNYAAVISFNSQFAKGYNYPNPNDPYQKQYVSNFFSPAYLILSLGMDYKPTNYLSFYLSPATGRLIFVNDQFLADQGAYGVDPAVYHYTITDTIRDKKGRTFKHEFGAYFIGKFQKDIMKNVNLLSRITLFDNYTDKVAKRRTNIVVNWEVMLNMKINKFLAANIYTNLIYDDQVNVPLTYNSDKTVVLTSGPRTQFKEVLGVGLSYKF